MDRTRRLAEGVHLAFIGLWLGALAMIGIGAPLVFITLRNLDPSLPAFAAYTGEHSLIAGGHIVRRLFGVCDVIQGVSAAAAGLSLVLIARATGACLLSASRLAVAALLILLLGYRFIFLDPDLSASLLGAWDAARAGDNERAAQLRALYNEGHRFEQRLFGATAIMVLSLLIMGWWSLLRSAPPAARSTHASL